MPARRYIVSPQGGGTATPPRPPYNYATDVTLLRRQARVFSGSDVQAYARTVVVGGTGPAPPVPPVPPVNPSNLLGYLNGLRGSGSILSGQWWDEFSSNGLDQFLPSSGANGTNFTVNDHASGNTGLTPAILGIYLHSAGASNSGGPSLANGIAIANAHMAAGGIVFCSFLIQDPSTGNITGPGTSWATINTPGSAFYNTLMAAVDAQAAALKQLNGVVLFRAFWENNLGQGSWWYGTNGTAGGTGCPTNAQFVTFQQNIINRLRVTNGVTNILFVYVTNYFSGAYSNNDPGPSYRDLVGMDMYGPTTQAGVLSNLSNAGGGMPYLSSLNLPILLSEVGTHSFNNSTVSTFTYDNNTWSSAVQSGAPNLVGSVIFCQNWALGEQLGAGNYMHNTITRAQLPAFGPNVPGPAAAQGFNTLTFNSSQLGATTGTWQPFNFFGISPPGAGFTTVQNSDGSFSISGSHAGGTGVATAVAAATSQGWKGVAFGGGGYFEMVASFTGQNVNSFPGGGPGLYWLDVEHASQGPYPVNWPGGSNPVWNSSTTYAIGNVVSFNGYLVISAANGNLNHTPPAVNGGIDNAFWLHYNDFFEVDIWEYDFVSTPPGYQFGIGNWYGNNPTLATSNPVNQQGHVVGSVLVPTGTDFSQQHRYGCLWKAATGSGQTTTTQGILQPYFDGVALGPPFNWDYHDPTQLSAYPNAPPVNGSTAMSGMDWRHMFLIFGSDTNQPTRVYSMKVWQTSAANNLVF